GVAGRPKAAASPASSESAGTVATSPVLLLSCGSVMAQSPCPRHVTSQDQGRGRFRATIPEEIRKIREALRQGGFLAHAGRAAGVAWTPEGIQNGREKV